MSRSSARRQAPQGAVRLRPYQREAVEAVFARRTDGIQRMVLALPTGSGKTIIFSELIRRAQHPVLVLAHREELIAQAAAKIAHALEGTRRTVGVEQGQRRASPHADVVVASIRSLHRERLGRVMAGRDVRLVIYDECHHAVAKENRRVLEDIGVFHGDWKGTLVGVTATTRRADGRGLDEVFQELVYSRSLGDMIEEGYLRPLKGIRVDTKVAVSSLPPEEDDFVEGAIDEEIDVEERNLLVARSIQDLGRDRRTIAFCGTVRHAQRLSAALNHLGVPCGIVCGEMPKPQRARTLRRFSQGRLQVITNVGVLTEGFDDPGVSMIAMVRPTRSEALYLQCVGRGMRLSPDAQDCVVLDFVDLSDLDIVTTATLDAGPKKEPPQREVADGPVPVVRHDPDEAIESEAPATLEEIQARLAAFDPLTMVQSEEVAAISPNAWLSLGARGMMLHFQDRHQRLCAFELRPQPKPRRRTEVWLEGRRLAVFGTMTEAVEAVDVELPRYGSPASARPNAPWRRQAPSPSLRAALRALTPPRRASTLGEALGHLALAEALTSTN